MKRVCVTGAGGYIGSWVVKLLLSKGYVVHGTVRDPCDETKNGHLKKLEHAEERLHLLKADMLDYESLCVAFAGCSGVVHVASPVPLLAGCSGVVHVASPVPLHVASTVPGSRIPNPQVEQLDPAILGTQNVLNACSKAKVEKVVVVSSGSAVMVNPKWTSDMELDESCWTDIEYANSTQNWYAVSKTTAEMEALNFAKRHDVTVVTICPSIVIGPMLQSTMNATSLLLLSYMKEEGRAGGDSMENIKRPYVDIRDVCEAIILLYENLESNGRYICSAYTLTTKEFVAKMECLYPGYNYPKIFRGQARSASLNSGKLLKLGWNYRPLEETIVDTIKNYEEAGLLEKGKPFPSSVTF